MFALITKGEYVCLTGTLELHTRHRKIDLNSTLSKNSSPIKKLSILKLLKNKRFTTLNILFLILPQIA
jgi:hypothetical protein